jgi:hypothetical protein
MSEDEENYAYEEVTQQLQAIIVRMFTIAATGIRNPLPTPPPKRPELLALIIGEAKVIGELGRTAFTRLLPP